MTTKVSNTDIIRFARNGLLFFGFWPLENPTTLYRLKTVAVMTIAMIYVLIAVFELVLRFISNDYTLISEQLGTSLPAIFFLVKIAIYRAYHKELTVLVDYICHPIFEVHETEFEKYIINAARQSTILTLLYAIFCGFCATEFSIAPLVTSNTTLPLPLSFDPGNYKFPIIIIEVVGIVLIASNNAIVDVLTVTFISVSSVQLDILGAKIRRSGVITDRKLVEEDRNTIISARLNNCVEHHVAIIK